jgi:phosphotransferase system enzyme I (PtsP)
MGGRSLEAMALIGIGINRLSITPVAVGQIKAMIRSLDHSELVPMVNALLDAPITDLRSRLTEWAERNGVSTG